jgi:hypothetical protein
MDTITVGCKLPNGFVIQAYQEDEYPEPVMGGGTRMQKRFIPVGKAIKLNGNRQPFGVIPEYLIQGGYALTPGVDKDVWDSWYKHFKESDLIKNHLIVAHEKGDTIGMAKAHKATTSGFEPLKQDGDPRMPKGIKRDAGKAA